MKKLFRKLKERPLVRKYKNEMKLAKDIEKNIETQFFLINENGERVDYCIRNLHVKYVDYVIFLLESSDGKKETFAVDISKAKTFKEVDNIIFKAIN